MTKQDKCLKTSFKGDAQSQPPVEEISRLHEAGFSLLPLGGGEDGKRPLTGFAKIRRLPLNQVLGPLYGRPSQIYGVRLDGLLVVDIDTDTPEAHAYVAKHFGVSTVQVKTPRGFHHYFELPEGVHPVAMVREGGISLDLKRGANSYVVGPMSVRPDGKEYEPIVGILGETPLPVFEANPQFPESGNISNIKPPSALSMLDSGKIRSGNRNAFLVWKAFSFVESMDSEAELLEELKATRGYECEDPESIPDSELAGIAQWTWRLRLNNQIFGGRDSGVFFMRSAMDKLLCLPSGQNAFALYCVLLANHSHTSGKRFTISPEGMKCEGLISFGRNACDRARNLLIEQGFLRRVGCYKPGVHAQHFQLTK